MNVLQELEKKLHIKRVNLNKYKIPKGFFSGRYLLQEELHVKNPWCKIENFDMQKISQSWNEPIDKINELLKQIFILYNKGSLQVKMVCESILIPMYNCNLSKRRFNALVKELNNA